MTQALYLRKLADYVKGATSLTQGPIWLLGHCYGAEKLDIQGHDAQLQEFLRDFRSRIWCTYRREFPPLDASGLNTDIGWGCTLRSSQMLLAEALTRHRLGRQWRRDTGEGTSVGLDVMELLLLFADGSEQPLSIHSICAAGHAYGVVPGKWLGPWVMCKTLEVLLAQPAVAARVGLRVHVVGDPGGGAPTVDGHRINELLLAAIDAVATATDLAGGSSGEAAPATGCCGNGVATSVDAIVPPADSSGAAASSFGDAVREEPSTASAAAGGSSSTCGGDAMGVAPAVSSSGVGCGEAVPTAGSAAAAAGGGVVSAGDESATAAGSEGVHAAREASQRGLLLVVPLTLGVDKVSPLYHPQLQAVLSFPQSVGIVGGRPGASLYFVGYQEGHLLYLDPHEGQAAGPLPATADSYFCEVPRLMPLASLDPSLAIGFYCASQEDFADLCLRLSELAQANSSAPLMTVATERMHEASHVYMQAGGDSLGEDGAFDEEDDDVTDGDGEGNEQPSALRAARGGSSEAVVGRELHRRSSQQHDDWEVI